MSSTHSYFKKYDDKVKELAKDILKGVENECFEIAYRRNNDFTDIESFNKYMDRLSDEYNILDTDFIMEYGWTIVCYKEYEKAYRAIEKCIEFSKSRDDVYKLCRNIGLVDCSTLNIYGNLILASKFGNFSFTPISNFSFVKYSNFCFSGCYDNEKSMRTIVSIQGVTYNNLFDALLNCTKNSYIMVTDKYNCVVALISSNTNMKFIAYYNICIRPLISSDIANEIEKSTFFELNKDMKFDISNKSYRAFLKNYSSDDPIISNFSVVKMNNKTGGCLLSGENRDINILWGCYISTYLFKHEFYQSLDDIPYEFEQKRIGQHLELKGE